MTRRLGQAVLASAILAASVVVPVLDWAPAGPGERPPVEVAQATIALRGVDPEVVSASQVAMAGWEHLAEGGSIEPLGLAPLDHEHTLPALDGDLAPAVAAVAQPEEEFGLVGVTTASPLDERSRVLVRLRTDGVWGAWTPLPVSEHGPDPESLEAAGVRFGTEPLLTEASDGVQVRIDTPGGQAPVDPQLTLLDNPVVDDDARIAPPGTSMPISTVAASTTSAPMPQIITRAQWGANEAQRRGAPQYSGTIKAAFLHHTVTTNDYTPEQAAQQVRNLYGWFTKGLRYSDMAYNFIVDRYGRLYEGRAGGMDRAVIGGHTAGFNNDTFAVSALGNFQKAALAPEQMSVVNESVAQLMAWKLAMSHRDPNGSAVLVSDSGAGTSRYRPGQQATTSVIGGHRDIGNTACPGRYLEPQVPTIRSLVSAKMGVTTFNPSITGPVAWGSPDQLVLNTTTTAPLAWNVTITSRCGATVRTLAGQQDAPGALAIGWDKLDANGQPVPPGSYTFTLNGTSGAEAVYPWSGTGVIASAPGSPMDPCGPPEAFTVAGSGWGHGIGMSQWGAYGMANEGADAATIVSHYYSGTTVTPVQDDMEVRVSLLHQVASAQIRSEALEAGGGAIEVAVGGNVVVGGPADTFAFRVEGASVGVARNGADLGSAPVVSVRWAGTRAPGSAAGGATLANVIGPKGSFGTPGHRYRHGWIDVTAASTSSGVRLNVVNSVRLHDEYLYGIAEVSSSWPAAALQAQAIAARSYALSKFNAGLRKACSCHVDDGDGPYTDQTFVGWSKQSAAQGDQWTAAVNATHASENQGLAVLYNGQPISAFYTSSTGGATTAVRDLWGGDLPYAVSVDDRWSLLPGNPNASWSVRVPQATAAKAFGVPGVWKLDVTERYTGGAAKTVTATLQDGTQKSISGSALRSALGLKSLYVTAIDGQAGAAAAAPAPAAPAPVAAPPAAAPASASVSMRISTSKPKPGSPVVFRGQVSSKAKGLTVERQMLVNGEWTMKARTTTKAKGRYAFTIKKAVPAGATYTYRVVVFENGAPIATGPEKVVKIRKKR